MLLISEMSIASLVSFLLSGLANHFNCVGHMYIYWIWLVISSVHTQWKKYGDIPVVETGNNRLLTNPTLPSLLDRKQSTDFQLNEMNKVWGSKV